MTKEERREYNRAWRAKNKFTFKRVSNTIYSNQRQTSRTRGHEMPTYTLEELRSWMLEQDNLNKLLSDYKESGGEKDLAVSVDRLKDELPYGLDNIQLGTWRENLENNHQAMRKPVIQMTLEGEFVKEWSSMNEARRAGWCMLGISKVCKGEQAKSRGFKWKFAK